MNTELIILLLNLPKLGRKIVERILLNSTVFPCNINEIEDFLIEKKQKISSINIPTAYDIQCAHEKTKKILNDSYEYNISILGFNDILFPKLLKLIPNPPVLLYTKGNVSILNDITSIAVIGTRNPTPHGEKVAERYGQVLAQKGIAVVSGLAHGCDASAHVGCVDVKGLAIAVMGQGLDKIYPAKNKKLADQILFNNGCLITEYPPLQKSHPSFFIDRDRLQSGLSGGTIVVETDVKGGTMHTVGFTLAQNRILGCYLHSDLFLQYSQTAGNRLLINEGKAMPLRGSEDVEKFVDLAINRIKELFCAENLDNQIKLSL